MHVTINELITTIYRTSSLSQCYCADVDVVIYTDSTICSCMDYIHSLCWWLPTSCSLWNMHRHT